MWRAFGLFVTLLLAVGLYVIVTGGATAHAATPRETGPGATEFGFALAAGAIALAGALFVSRPRMRFRR